MARPAATSAHNTPAARRTGRLVRGVVTFGGAQACDRTEHQHAGHSAADRGLRQRDIDRREPDPGDRQQQPVDDEADNGRERFARGNRRSPDPQDQDDKTDIENRQDGHPCGPRCRTAPAMSCVTIAPDNWTSSQMLTSFNAPNSPFACGNRPRTTRPRPRLSTLVSACRRVSESGKRIKPTVPAKKNNAPGRDGENGEDVKREFHPPLAAFWDLALRIGRASDERDRRERGEQRQQQCNIHDRRRLGRRGQQKQVWRRHRCPGAAPPSCGQPRPGAEESRTSRAPPSSARSPRLRTGS